jgi:hypothetical protein
LVLGAMMVLAGAIWLAQGLNLPFAPGSFMTADPLWAFIGAVTAAVGVYVVASALRVLLRGPRAGP